MHGKYAMRQIVTIYRRARSGEWILRSQLTRPLRTPIMDFVQTWQKRREDKYSINNTLRD